MDSFKMERVGEEKPTRIDLSLEDIMDSGYLGILDVLKDFAEGVGTDKPIKGGLALVYLYGEKEMSARNTTDIDYHFRKLKD